MTEKIEKEQTAKENHGENEQPTLMGKIAISVIIGYVISLIWLVGSKHWYGIW